MKGATACARRLKGLIRSLRSKLGKVTLPAVGDPVSQLILGIFSRDVPESKARQVLDSLRSAVVDYNDLRVIPVSELVEIVGEYPDVRLKCEDMSRALNRLFLFEHSVTFERIAQGPKKDVLAYLDKLDGLEAYTRGRIRLLGFQMHACPLDEAMWAVAAHEEIIDPKCSLLDAQSFLERQVPEEEALEFFALLRQHAWAEMGAAVRGRSVQRIVSIPPDRTSRNMLRMIAAGHNPEEIEFEPPEPLDGEAPLEIEREAQPEAEEQAQPAKKKKSAAKSRPERSATKKQKSEPKARSAKKAKAKSA